MQFLVSKEDKWLLFLKEWNDVNLIKHSEVQSLVICYTGMTLLYVYICIYFCDRTHL
jgi:hypothetical protein